MKSILKDIAKSLMLATGLVVAAIALTTALAAYALNPTRTLSEKSIVKVLNAEGTGGGTGWATLYRGRPAIITNDHVCAVESGGYVTIESDYSVSLKKIIKRNFERDLCLIQGVAIPPLKLASNGPNRFDALRVMGHPLLKPTSEATGQYTGSGIISIGLSPNPDGTCPKTAEAVDTLFGSYCLQRMEVGFTTVPIAPGNSGSPVVNSNGEVVGVMNSGDNVIHQGNFIPLEYVKELLNE